MDASTQKTSETTGPRILAARDTKIVASDVNIYYGEKHAIKNLSIHIPDRAVSAFIGPSGCGKSTFLRTLNRMNDTLPIARAFGGGGHPYASAFRLPLERLGDLVGSTLTPTASLNPS